VTSNKFIGVLHREKVDFMNSGTPEYIPVGGIVYNRFSEAFEHTDIPTGLVESSYLPKPRRMRLNEPDFP
jgi:hypothetical protein